MVVNNNIYVNSVPLGIAVIDIVWVGLYVYKTKFEETVPFGSAKLGLMLSLAIVKV